MVSMGRTYLQPDLGLRLWDFRLQPIATQFAKLSFREYEILNLIAKHKSYDEISDRLHISLKTIYNLKMSAFKKLSIESRDQLLEILKHTMHYKNKSADGDNNQS
jgi:DNA-binding CsgD family transcriptional regulator